MNTTTTTTKSPGRAPVKIDRDGTSWSDRTPDDLIEVLRVARNKKSKLHFSYGFTDEEGKPAGRNWLEEFDCTGYIGRSNGEVKIPLVLKSKSSGEGCGLLSSSIVRVIRTSDNTVLWQHPSYHQGKIELRKCSFKCDTGRMLYCEALVDGQVHARFKDVGSARRWAAKLRVKTEGVISG